MVSTFFQSGDVLMAVKDVPPYLKRGHLYRVRERVPSCHAYWLEGIVGVGFWSARFEKPRGSFTRSGPIHRIASPTLEKAERL